MDEYDITVEYKKLYDSFMKFLKISSTGENSKVNETVLRLDI